MRGTPRLAALLVPLALAVAGCAAMTPAPGKAPGAPPAAPPASGAPRSPAAAVNDSAPTPEALAVLATIPEPVGGSSGVSAPAPPDAYDTLRTQVPVPGATAPLATPAPLPAELPPAAAVPPAAAATSKPDTCWRVQIAAPSDAQQGKAMSEAGESQLMVPMSVDHEAGRYKVRSRDCLSHAAAEKLRARANDSGFQGAFLVRMPVSR
jgi:hypothetical protein